MKSYSDNVGRYDGFFCTSYSCNVIVALQDVIGSIVLAIFFLCGSAPSASYSSQWGEPLDLCDEDNAIFRFNDSLSCEHMRLTWLLAGLAVSYASSLKNLSMQD